MPVQSWTPQNVMRPVVGAFRPAVYQATNLARATAPGPKTRAAVRSKLIGAYTAQIDALRMGPRIYPIVSGSRAGIRETQGWFTSSPGGKSEGHPSKTINHPGTPPHNWLDRVREAFPALYGANVRRRWGR